MTTIAAKDLDVEKTYLGLNATITDSYNKLYYTNNSGNCKLCTLDSIGPWLCKERIEYVKKVLMSSCKLICNVTLNYQTQIDFLKQHFKIVSIAEIPVGYGTGMQYHVCFLTGYTRYSGYNGYVSRINKMQKPTIPIDNVDVIFENLKHIEEADLQKIKSYKQPKRAKDLLKKILETK